MCVCVCLQYLGQKLCSPNLHTIGCQADRSVRLRGDIAAQLELWVERMIQLTKQMELDKVQPERTMASRFAYTAAALRLAHSNTSQEGVHELVVSGNRPTIAEPKADASAEPSMSVLLCPPCVWSCTRRLAPVD